MAYISKIKINNVAYDVKDSEARAQIAALQGISGALILVGTGVLESTDASLTAAAERIAGSAKANGAVVIVTDENTSHEFVYNENQDAWVELGAEGIYLTESKAQTTYMPLNQGFKGTATVTDYATGITGSSYTPAGSVSLNHANTAAAVTTQSVTPTISLTLDKYTPAGSVSGTVTPKGSVTVNKITPAGSVTIDSYTPAGSVSVTAPAINNGADLMKASYSTSDETLVLTPVTVTAAAPTATFTGTAKAPTGSFSGTAVTPTATFAGSSSDLSASFTGTAVAPTGSATSSAIDVVDKVTYSKASSASFSGTAATIKNTLTTGSKTINVTVSKS